MPGDAAAPSTCAAGLFCPDGQVCSLDRCTTRACAEEEKTGVSFAGCLFYTVEGDNVAADVGRDSSLIVTNPSGEVVRVEIQDRTVSASEWTAFMSASVPPWSSHRLSLNRRQVGDPGITPAAALRVAADRPITLAAVQSDDREQNATSSSGTIVLPVHVLGNRYRAVAVPQHGGPPIDATPGSRGGAARVLVVGVQRPVVFRFQPTAPAMVGPIGVEPPLAANQSRTFRLEDGDVFQAYSVNDEDDLTGSEIVGEGVTAVFSGNVSTLYGRPVTGIHSPDAVHEQLLPTASWGTAAVAVALPPQRNTCDTLFGTPGTSMWRIVADAPMTEVQFSAPETVAGLPSGPVTLGSGKVLDLLVTGGSFTVRGTAPIHVMQALDCEPSLAAAVPAERLFLELRFAVLPGFDYVVGIVRPSGEAVSLDGSAIPDRSFAPAGEEMEAATVQLPRCPPDEEVCTHHLAGKFGMTLRGMDVVCGYALTAPSWPGCAPLNPTCVP